MPNKNAVTIQAWLQEATHLLETVSDAPRLEAEVLLANILHTQRSYLFAWPEQILQSSQQQSAEEYLQRRLANEPIAYILGHKEFWDIDLKVSANTLIPRPETELLVEITLDHLPAQQRCIVADLGTGSGAIALALAKERPQWNIIATDQSPAALNIAKTNAKLNDLAANIHAISRATDPVNK